MYHRQERNSSRRAEKGTFRQKTPPQRAKNQIFEPDVRFTTWDDYAILSMVESGLGVSILPELILRRIPYRVAIRELEERPCRELGFALCSRKSASVAVRRFLEYLPCREMGNATDGEWLEKGEEA